MRRAPLALAIPLLLTMPCCTGHMEPVPPELVCSALPGEPSAPKAFVVVQSVELPDGAILHDALASDSGRYYAATVYVFRDDRYQVRVCVWDMSVGERVLATPAEPNSFEDPRGIMFSPDERHLAVFDDPDIEVWSLDGSETCTRFPRGGFPDEVDGLRREDIEPRLPKDNAEPVLARRGELDLCAPGTLHDSATGRTINLVKNRNGMGTPGLGAISADGSRVAIAYGPRMAWLPWERTDETPYHVRVWDARDGRLVAGVMLLEPGFLGISAAPVLLDDGSLLVVVEMRHLRLFDLRRRTELARTSTLAWPMWFDTPSVVALGDDRFAVPTGSGVLVYRVRPEAAEADSEAHQAR